MAQFKGFSGLRTYTVPLQRDLNELARYIKDIEGRLGRLVEGESINVTSPTSSLAHHATTHATGGSNTDPLDVFSFTWKHEHIFTPTSATRRPLTINAHTSQTASLLLATDANDNDVIEWGFDGKVGLGDPTRNATLNIRISSNAVPPDDISGMVFWNAVDDISPLVADGVAIGISFMLNKAPGGSSDYDLRRSAIDGPIIHYNAVGTHKSITTSTSPDLLALRVVPLNITGAYTYFVVYHATTGGNALMMGNHQGGAGGTVHYGWRMPSNTASTTASIRYNSSSLSDLTASFDAAAMEISPNTNYHIGTVVREAGGDHYYYHKGQAIAAPGGGRYNNTATMVIRTLFAHSGSFIAQTGTGFVEHILYNVALTAEQVQQITNYLLQQYGDLEAVSGGTPAFQWQDVDTSVLGEISEVGYLHVGGENAVRRVHITDTATQLRVAYDSNTYLELAVGSTGTSIFSVDGTSHLTIDDDDYVLIENFSTITAVNTTTQGALWLGNETGLNLLLDNAQIQARSTTLASTLYIQPFGGPTEVGDLSSVSELRVNSYTVMAPQVGGGNTLTLQAAAGATSSTYVAICKDNLGAYGSGFDNIGMPSNYDGTELTYRFTSHTDNPGGFPIGIAFIFRRSGTASLDHTQWINSPSTIISHMDTAGQLYFGSGTTAPYAYITRANIWTLQQQFELQLALKAISEPSSPASGYVALYIDTADGAIKVKKSSGTVVNLEEVYQISRGTVLPTASATTVSLFLLDRTASTLGDIFYVKGKLGNGNWSYAPLASFPAS